MENIPEIIQISKLAADIRGLLLEYVKDREVKNSKIPFTKAELEIWKKSFEIQSLIENLKYGQEDLHR